MIRVKRTFICDWCGVQDTPVNIVATDKTPRPLAWGYAEFQQNTKGSVGWVRGEHLCHDCMEALYAAKASRDALR